MTTPTMILSQRRRRSRGLTLIEILVAMAVMTMMTVSVWTSFRTTAQSMRYAEQLQVRYAIIRNSMSRMAAELSMAYLSFNRPADEDRHFTLFDGRDQFTLDNVTFSSFSHVRMRKDANESDQSVIQYFVERDPKDPSRTHLFRRESRRLTGDIPDKMIELFPAYIFCEDIKSFDVKYWDVKKNEWVDEWRTTKQDMQPDRLPERVKITLGIMDPNLGKEVKYTVQTLLFMQEKLDFSK
jgi:general secretion pathway protein J